MKILITGQAGFVGSMLTKKLLKLGHSIVGIDNFSFGFKENIEPFIKDIKFYEMNIIEQRLKDIFKKHKIDLIVHLASSKIPRFGNTFGTLRNNCVGTYNLLKKSDSIPCIFTSTSDVYAKLTETPFNEDDNMIIGSPIHRRWTYAVSKIYDENLLIASWEKFKKPYNIIRLFNVYGENCALDWTGGAIPQLIGKALKGEPLEIHGDGTQTRCFTYIDDVVDGLVKIISGSKWNQILNMGNTDMVSINELAGMIWGLCRIEEMKVKYIPYKNFFGNYEDVTVRQPDIGRIKKIYGWKPTTELLEGLKKTIEWQKKRMGL